MSKFKIKDEFKGGLAYESDPFDEVARNIIFDIPEGNCINQTAIAKVWDEGDANTICKVINEYDSLVSALENMVSIVEIHKRRSKNDFARFEIEYAKEVLAIVDDE